MMAAKQIYLSHQLIGIEQYLESSSHFIVSIRNFPNTVNPLTSQLGSRIAALFLFVCDLFDWEEIMIFKKIFLLLRYFSTINH